jgi:hypothetical protein
MNSGAQASEDSKSQSNKASNCTVDLEPRGKGVKSFSGLETYNLAMVTIIIRENKSIQEENYIYFWFIL